MNENTSLIFAATVSSLTTVFLNEYYALKTQLQREKMYGGNAFIMLHNFCMKIFCVTTQINLFF